jgi:hypothetical protein
VSFTIDIPCRQCGTLVPVAAHAHAEAERIRAQTGKKFTHVFCSESCCLTWRSKPRTQPIAVN